MNCLEKIICFIGGANLSVLKKCPTDKQKFIALGIGVLNTSILSMFTMGYAIYSVAGIDNLLILNNSEICKINTISILLIVFTLFWGFIIFSIDWGLISTIHKKAKYDFISGIKLIITTLFRLLVTLIISFTVSKPLEVIVFKDYLPLVKREMKVNFENRLNEKNEARKDSSNTRIYIIEQQKINLDRDKQSAYNSDPVILTLLDEKSTLFEQYKFIESKYIELNKKSIELIKEVENSINQISANAKFDLTIEEKEEIEKNKRLYIERRNIEKTEINRRNSELQSIINSIDIKQQQINERILSIDSVFSIKKNELDTVRSRLIREYDYLSKIANEETEKNDEASQILDIENFINNIVAIGYIENWKNEPQIDSGKKAIAEKISFFSILLTILITIIDTAPIIIKLLIKRGCYEEEIEKMEKENSFKRIVNLKILEKTYPNYANLANEYNTKIQELKDLEEVQYRFNNITKHLIINTFNEVKSTNREFKKERHEAIKILLADFQNKLITQLNITKDKMFDLFSKFIRDI